MLWKAKNKISSKCFIMFAMKFLMRKEISGNMEFHFVTELQIQNAFRHVKIVSIGEEKFQ